MEQSFQEWVLSRLDRILIIRSGSKIPLLSELSGWPFLIFFIF